MTVFSDAGASRTFNYRAGDVGYVPVGYGHYVQNIGNETIWFLEAFKSDRFESISLSQMMAITPYQLIASNLNVNPEFLDALNSSKLQCPVLPCLHQTDFSDLKFLTQDKISNILG